MEASTNPPSRGSRLDREDYFNAAFKTLADEGFHELTADSLCAALGVTRGSFYHHFASMPEFVAALMEAWQETVHGILRGLVATPDVEAVAAVLDAMERWPLRAEAALRGWSWTEPEIAVALRRWDLARETAGREWLARVVDDRDRCRVLAHMGTAMWVGMAVLQRPMDRELIIAASVEFLHSIVGIELARDLETGQPAPRLGAAVPGLPAGPLDASAPRHLPRAEPVRAKGHQPTGRLDRQAYFNAAFRILAEEGFQGLTVDALCVDLGVTRGSFYHHFDGMPDLVDGLLLTWEASLADLLAGWVAMPPMDVAVHFAALMPRWPFQAEAALRAWAWSNPAVARSVRRWELTIGMARTSWFEQIMRDPKRARVLSHMCGALEAGMFTLQRPVDIRLVMSVIGEFVRCIIGIDLFPIESGGFVIHPI